MSRKKVPLTFLMAVLLTQVPSSMQRASQKVLVGQPRPIDETIISFSCSKDGDYPNPMFCEKFFRCRDGLALPYACPSDEDFLFNDVYNICDYASEVHCWDRIRPDGVSPTWRPPVPTTPRPTTTPSTPRPTGPINCTVNGAVPHPEFCEFYYDCWNFTATLLRCPNNSLFDPLYGGCVPPNDVDCGDRIRPGFSCPVNGPDGGSYPDPLSCSSYYICSNGNAIHQVCPDALVYNKFLEVCDFPINVDCSDRYGEIQSSGLIVHNLL